MANPAHPFPRSHSVIDALFKSGLWREGWGLRNMDLKAILCAVKQKLHYQVTYFQQKRTQSWDEFSSFLRILHLFLTFFYILASILFFVKFSLHYFLIQSVINLFFLHKTANSRWRKNVLCYTISQEPNQIRDEKLIQAKHWLTWKRKKENIITLHKKYILWHFYPFLRGMYLMLRTAVGFFFDLTPHHRYHKLVGNRQTMATSAYTTM